MLDLAEMVGLRGEDFRVSVPELTVQPGEAVAVIGRSGAGKSTILDMLACVLRPASTRRMTLSARGRKTDVAALWDRRDLDGLRALRAASIGYVLQTGGLAPFLTMAQNVALPAWRDGRSDAEAGPLLEALGIADLAARKPAAVSVGQRQRAAIARALAGEPALVLADEPTGSLDADTAEEVMALLTRLVTQRGAALVLVTHDRPLAERHGFRLLECRPDGPNRSCLRPVAAAA
ncbi:MAG: ATP-binding cassette domain-containing protein [Pseudomonadota bacterium]